jgi:hypothetical protein
MSSLPINQCGKCSYRIALRRPTSTVPASPWKCRRCDSVYLASPQLRDGSVFFAGTRPAFYFDVVDDAASRMRRPAELSRDDVNQLKRCLLNCGVESDARRHKRFAVAIPVNVIPLSEDCQIVGGPARALTIDISAGGIAVMHPEDAANSMFAIDFSPSNVNLTPVVMRKLRSTPIGSAFAIAGEFVSRIEY